MATETRPPGDPRYLDYCANVIQVGNLLHIDWINAFEKLVLEPDDPYLQPKLANIRLAVEWYNLQWNTAKSDGRILGDDEIRTVDETFDDLWVKTVLNYDPADV